jgi:hypothetical protein
MKRMNFLKVKAMIKKHNKAISEYSDRSDKREAGKDKEAKELLLSIEADMSCGLHEGLPCNICRNALLDSMFEYMRLYRPKSLNPVELV